MDIEAERGAGEGGGGALLPLPPLLMGPPPPLIALVAVSPFVRGGRQVLVLAAMVAVYLLALLCQSLPALWLWLRANGELRAAREAVPISFSISNFHVKYC